jgi:hypothetical protein
VSVNDDEAKVVDRLARGVLSGRSVTSLVAELNGEGVPTSTGGRWSSRTLRRVLLRPHPVTADVADVLRTLLDDPSRRTTPGPARRWLLSGLALCGAAGCGGPLLGSGSSLGAGRGTYPAYRCKTGKHTVISAVTLDEFIGAVVVARLQRGDIHQPPAEDLDALHNEAGKLRKRLDELADNLDLDERTLSRRAAALNRKLAAVQGRIAAALSSSPVGDMDGLPPEEFWATRTLERRRAIVDAFMTVTIVAGRRGVIPKAERWRPDLPSFDPLRVQVEWR